MKLRLMGTRPSCVLYSAAMLLDMHPLELENKLGNSGLEVVFPKATGRRRLRSHHIQEIIWIASLQGKGFVPYYREVALEQGDELLVIPEGTRWIKSALKTRLPAMLCTSSHAMAWDGKQIYDPMRGIKEITPELIDSLDVVWLMCDLINKA
jgi:hypothetical protein